VPLEEAIAAANTRLASLSVGVRVVSSTSYCLAVHTPPEPAEGSRHADSRSVEHLQALVEHAAAAAKVSESRRFAHLLAPLAPACDRAQDEAAEYFLARVDGPVVVVEVLGDPPDPQTLFRTIAETIAAFVE
jgi:hypothetical protein